MIFRITLGLVLVFAFLQADDSPKPEPKLVDLNVIALDSHGQPVTDLTADDFEVTEAGKAQKLSFFRRNSGPVEPAPALGPNQFSNRTNGELARATVILFDLLNEGFASRGRAADEIVRKLQTLESADSLYLYILTVDGRLVAVRGLAEGAVRAPQGPPWTQQIKPLMDEAMRVVTRIRSVDIDVAIRVQLTYAALDAMGIQLSRVPGRKNVVWITDGVPIALGPARSDTGEEVDFTPQLRRLSESLDLAGVALYPVRQVMLGSPDDIGANSGAGYTGGLGTGEQSISTLDQFADMTGGRPSTDKDIGSVVRQAMTDLRTSYQIGYYPSANNWNGKFHKLRVTCKRKGVRIQSKAGYYAWPEPAGARAQQAFAATAATMFDAAEIGLRATVSADPKDTHAAHIDLRIDARDLALVQVRDRYIGQLRIAIVGYLADGHPLTGPVAPLDVNLNAAERDQALKDGIDFSQKVVAGQDETKFRMIVFDRGSNSVGSVSFPVGTGPPAQH